MKKIRKLNLSPGQLLTCDEQDAIVAGKTRSQHHEGECRCQWDVSTFHMIYYYFLDTPEQSDIALAKSKREEAEQLQLYTPIMNQDRIQRLLREAAALEKVDRTEDYTEIHEAMFDPDTRKLKGHKTPTICYPNSIGCYQ